MDYLLEHEIIPQTEKETIGVLMFHLALSFTIMNIVWLSKDCFHILQASKTSPMETILTILREDSDETFDRFCLGLLETKQKEIVQRFLLNDGKIYLDLCIRYVY